MIIDNSDISDLLNTLSNCKLCPHECSVDRINGEFGICGVDDKIKVASYGPHYGEEPELVGFSSSGTIFFSGCNLLCCFCQNYDISHFKTGKTVSTSQLKEIMLTIQAHGSSNINLVTPTQFSPQIIQAILEAKDAGLRLPIVYNSSGYDKVETLKQWEGIIDIYMPDLKFYRKEKSRKYTSAPDYFDAASKAIIEMHRQVGDLVVLNGVALKGLLIRHLILPNNQSDTKEIIDFIADNIGTETYLNLMEQYRPCYKADDYPELNSRITQKEYQGYIDYAKQRGFYRPDYVFEYLNF